jgi:hypothetical protein
VTGRADSNLRDVRLDRAAAQDDSLERQRQRLGQADPLGSPMHSKWACRDEAACQERQAQRKEKPAADPQAARVRQVPGCPDVAARLVDHG